MPCITVCGAAWVSYALLLQPDLPASRQRHPNYCPKVVNYTVLACRSKPAITEAAKGIIFPPEVVSAAAMIVKKLGPFVGVHLRLEGDWPWPRAEEHWVREG